MFKWSQRSDELREMFVVARAVLGHEWTLRDGGVDLSAAVFHAAQRLPGSLGDAVRAGEITAGAIGMQIRCAVTDQLSRAKGTQAAQARRAAVAADFMSSDTAEKLNRINGPSV